MIWRDYPKNPVTETHMLSIDAKMGRRNLEYNITGLVECVCLCGNYVLVAPRAGFESGMINVFKIGHREMIHSIATKEDEAVFSMVCSKNKLLYGTLEGSCFSFLLDSQSIKSTSIDSFIGIQNSLWVSTSNQIHVLNSETLNIKRSHYTTSCKKMTNTEAYRSVETLL